MKLAKKLRKRWQSWQFQRKKPVVANRRALLVQAVKKGKSQEGGNVRNY